MVAISCLKSIAGWSRSYNLTEQAGLDSNPVEFDGVETWVVEPLPKSEKLHRIAVAQPVTDNIVRVIWVFVFGNVSQTDDVLLILRKHSDGSSQNFDSTFFCFAHGYFPKRQIDSKRRRHFTARIDNGRIDEKTILYTIPRCPPPLTESSPCSDQT
jgi:hypothetical protein